MCYKLNIRFINWFEEGEEMSGGIFGIWQWVVVGLIVVLLFARPGKISGLMGDFGKGLSNFKKGMKDEERDNKSVEEEISDNTDKNKS